MEIIIRGEPSEIAEFAVEMQKQEIRYSATSHEDSFVDWAKGIKLLHDFGFLKFENQTAYQEETQDSGVLGRESDLPEEIRDTASENDTE